MSGDCDFHLHWSCSGVTFVGFDPDGTARDVIAALQKFDPEARSTSGRATEMMAIELRARGFVTRIHIMPGHILRHPGCGRLYTVEEWGVLGVETRAAVSLGGIEVKMPSRHCRCGGWVSYRDIDLVHAEDACNSRAAPRGKPN